MSIAIRHTEPRTEVYFIGTPTTDEERKRLQETGFIHVTGLTAYDRQTGKPIYVIGEKTKSKEKGRYCYNNSKMVVVTNGGEVWLYAYPSHEYGTPDHQEAERKRERAVNSLAGHGDVFVPLSSGERVDVHRLMARVADPYDGLIVES